MKEPACARSGMGSVLAATGSTTMITVSTTSAPGGGADGGPDAEPDQRDRGHRQPGDDHRGEHARLRQRPVPSVTPSRSNCSARSPSTAMEGRRWHDERQNLTRHQRDRGRPGTLASRSTCRRGTATRLVWIILVPYSEVIARAPSRANTK
ncbi:hypothetical protein [Nonomuraea dietziae]|uniref:hypothetical protein n=1 Tax=Nonomuraea dietziae TaxID=65515 RepID=UPI0031D7F069